MVAALESLGKLECRTSELAKAQNYYDCRLAICESLWGAGHCGFNRVGVGDIIFSHRGIVSSASLVACTRVPVAIAGLPYAFRNMRFGASPKTKWKHLLSPFSIHATFAQQGVPEGDVSTMEP